MTDKSTYKNTIRLPKTSFSMKANLKKLSDKIRKEWDDNNIYKQLRNKSKGLQKFILHDGPPYANGNIHLGTSFNKILKDIIIKGYQLIGFDAPFVIGWDCHGLPIEWKIEEIYKKKGIDKNNINVLEFREECRKFAQKWLDIQKEEFKMLGIIADFDKPYNTMDKKSESLIYKEITKCLMKGNVYLGQKPVMWSVVEETALAEAEIEYHDKISDAIYVGFEITEAPKNNWLGALMAVWTTTPWTLPNNEALAYNPEITYGLYEVKEVESESLIKENVKLVLAEDLKYIVLKELKIKRVNDLDKVKGLKDFKAKTTLYEAGFSKIVNLYPAKFVEATMGTGIVHIAPTYGLDDFYLSKKFNIPHKDILNDNGTYLNDIPIFAGQHIFKVNQSIIDTLSKYNKLLKSDKIKHSYPHSWRSKAPLIFRLTTQVFLNLDHNSIRDKCLKVIENEIKFFPSTGKNRLSGMIKNRPDWCLSRQRLWGVPLGLFIHKETNEILKDEEVNQNIINAFAKEGSDAWFRGDPKRFLTDKYNKNDYKEIYDVIDVWFDSGTTHAFVLREREELNVPADIYLEGSDQHRGWFQSSLVESMLSFNEAPFKNIITHGYVLDNKMQKMSKSLGNVITPQEIIDKYGIEILRLWVVNSDYQSDVRIGEVVLNQQVDIYRKLRNTFKYILGNLTYFNQEDTVSYDDLDEIEKFILHKIFILNQKVIKCYKESYEFHNLFDEIYNFITIDLSAFYFDIRKDTLYCDSSDDIKFKSCMKVLDILFNYLVKWIAPFITYTAEEVFKERYGNDKTIMLETLQLTPNEWLNNNIFNKWERIKQIRKVVLGSIEIERANKVIGSSLEASPTVYLKDHDLQLLQNVDLATVCITSDIILDMYDAKSSNAFVDLNVKDIAVVFHRKDGHKCERCWKIVTQLKSGNLCNRCFEVLSNLKFSDINEI